HDALWLLSGVFLFSLQVYPFTGLRYDPAREMSATGQTYNRRGTHICVPRSWLPVEGRLFQNGGGGGQKLYDRSVYRRLPEGSCLRAELPFGAPLRTGRGPVNINSDRAIPARCPPPVPKIMP